MISFIIIGRNEGWKLTKCLQSVFDTITYNNLKDYEVVYVDSKSTDDSIDRAKQFQEVKIFQITGVYNAAIARNIGAKEAKGDVLFFIDGDMEIIPDFLSKVFDSQGDLLYNVFTGQTNDKVYDIDGTFLTERPRTYKNKLPKQVIEQLTVGGLFIVKRSLWICVDGMKTKYRKSQDNDFFMRLRRKGQIVYRLPYLMAIHHTVDYRNSSRMWKMLFSGDTLYGGVIFRDHIYSIERIKTSLRGHYTSVVLLAIIPLLFISGFFWLIPSSIYGLILAFRVIVGTKRRSLHYINNMVKYCIERMLYQIIRDLTFLYSVLFFFPTSKRVEYIRITEDNKI